MQDERDYYSILGVPANAPETEIRRAFRARAKELHPDSKPAGDREQAHREFNLLTEAYDALKDPERRRAYDEALRHSRQLTRVQSKGRPPGAFAMGLAVGILIAGAGVGAVIFLDRSARLPKSQESLRITKIQQQPPLAAGPSAERGTDAAPAAIGGPRLMPAPEPAEERPAADRTRVAAKEAGPVETAPAPAARAAGDGGPAIDRGPAVDRSPPVDRVPPVDRSPAADQSRPARTQRSQFVGEVLLLESQTGSDTGGVAVYRLVSLVNSSTAVDELAEAASLASRRETVDLLRGRIAALKEEQGRQPASIAKPQEVAVQQSAPAASPSSRQDGTYDVATGARTAETILRLHPGSGLKESFSDCAACPEMVTVPGGQTIIGARPENPGYRPDEGPAHKIAIQKPFAVSKHGISAENWRACVDAGICRPTLASYLTAGPGIPATRVSWFDAKTYVEWLSKSTGRRYRLLSEAEWEYTAQAGKASDAAQRAESQAGGRGAASGLLRLGGAGLKQMGETKPNGWGVFPLPGSLLEWVEDCWHGTYAQAPQDGSPWLSGNGGDCAYRVVRGVAAAGGDFGGRRLAGRARESADARSPALGFRIARDLNAQAKTALDASGTPGGKSARGE